MNNANDAAPSAEMPDETLLVHPDWADHPPSSWPLFTRAQMPILLGIAFTSVLVSVTIAHAIQNRLMGPLTGLMLTTFLMLALFFAGAARHSSILRHRTHERDIAELELSRSEARLRLAQSAAGIATMDWNIANDHAVWSSNFVEVFGVPFVGADTRSPYEVFIALVHPDDRARIDSMHLGILTTGGAFSEEFRIRKPDGQTRWIATRGEVLCDANGLPNRLIGSNFDITERHLSEKKLQESLTIIDLAHDAGEIGIWNKDMVVRKGTWDERSRRIFGLPSPDNRIDFKAFRRSIHPADWNKVRSTLIEGLKSGDKFALECRIVWADKSVHWIRIRGLSQVNPKTGRSSRVTGIVFDITERREREKHVRVLMRELTHRSKNLLAVIQAMARQTGHAAASLDDFQTRFSARLQGLSASHDLLVNEDWRGAFLPDVVRSQLAHFSDLIDHRIRLHGDNLQLKPEAAQNIGLALHELSTNAAKYGSLANATGKVEISWRMIEMETGAPTLQIVWEESGGPEVEQRERRGFGAIMTERIVARALDGQVVLAFEPSGVRWALEIPASYVLGTIANA